MKIVGSAFFGSLALVSSCFASPPKDSSPYWEEKNNKKELKEPLVLREEQGGIAGRQVWTWTIQPSGEWRYAQFKLDPEGKEIAKTREEKSGALTQEQLLGLAKELARRDLAGLPGKFGQEVKVNPHRYLVHFGAKQTILEGAVPRRGGAVRENILQSAPAEEKNQASPWVRLADIAHVVCESCGAMK